LVDHLLHLRDEVARFQTAIEDLDVSVPSCPGWRIRHLVHHLGTVHRTFGRVAAEGWMRRPPAPDPDDRPDVHDDRVVDWAADQAAALLDALAELDPEAPRWNFSPGPQVGAFIPRRMLHETTIHRWDAEGAVGARSPIDPVVAADGIVEYLEVFLPRSGAWAGRPTVLHTVVDGGPTLELLLEPGATAVLGDAPLRVPDIVVGGSPEAVLLAWWDRAPLEALRTAGDADALADVRNFAYT
jgi:uncharacterized protein (TIGR03083 family)